MTNLVSMPKGAARDVFSCAKFRWAIDLPKNKQASPGGAL